MSKETRDYRQFAKELRVFVSTSSIKYNIPMTTLFEILISTSLAGLLVWEVPESELDSALEKAKELALEQWEILQRLKEGIGADNS